MADKKFLEESLKAHNEYRKRHQAPPLKLNKDICAIAQRWADNLARRDNFQHSSPAERQYKGEQMGENIGMKWTSTNEDFTGQTSTDNWYSEVAKYDFNNNSGPGTGHFTQVVWKGSRELGVGKAQTKGGKWLVVANYYPAGNFIGRYGENVLPPKDGKIVLPKEDKPKASLTSFGRPGEPSMESRFQGMKLDQGRPSGGSGARSIHTETQTITGSDGVTKTIKTTTEILPDGSKKVTTEESTSRGGAGASRRF